MFNIFSSDKGKLASDDKFMDDSSDLDSMSFDDLDQDFTEESEKKDDRNPTVAVVKGFTEGVATEAVSPRFINSILRKALPSEYGEIVNVASEASGVTTDMYDSAVRETKPVLARLAKRVDRLVPEELSGIKKATRGLAEFLGEDYQTYTGMSSEQVQEQGITNTLAKIFGAKEEADQVKEAKDKAQKDIDKNIEFKKFGASQRILTGMHNSLERISKYNENINLAYQNKSLELQLRSYFGQKEMYKKQDAFNTTSTRQLESIVKNTALPEFSKIKSSEAFREKLRDRFQNYGLNLFSQNDVIQDIATTMKRNASAAVRGALETMAYPMEDLAEALQAGVDQYKEMITMMKETGSSKADIAEMEAKMAGAMVAGYIQDAIRTPIAKFLKENIPEDSNLIRGLYKGKTALSNPYATINTWKADIAAKAEEEKDTGEWGVNRALSSLLSLTDGMGSSQSRTLSEGVNIRELDNPTIGGITERINTSVNEIIPGYLARILSQLEDISGNDDQSSHAAGGRPKFKQPKEKSDLTVMDLKTGRWMRKGDRDKQLWDDFEKEMTITPYDDETKKAVDKIVGDTSGVSDATKAELGTMLRKLSGDKYTTFTDEGIRGNEAENKPASRLYSMASPEVKDLIDKFYDGIKPGEASVKNGTEIAAGLAGTLANIRELTRDPMTSLEALIKSGSADPFVERGIATRDKSGSVRLDETKYFEYLDNRNREYIKSDETTKHKGGMASKALDTIKNIPIFKWKYKEGEGDINGESDRAEHVGGMAQTFHSATKKNFGAAAAEETAPGGTKVSTIDALGLNMGATQELSDKVDALSESVAKPGYIKSSEDAKDISGLFKPPKPKRGRPRKTPPPPPPPPKDKWEKFFNFNKEAELSPLEMIANDVHAIRTRIDKGTFIISPTIDLSNLKIDMPNVDIAKYGTGISGLLRHALEVGIQTTTKTVSTIWDAGVTAATFSWNSVIKPTSEFISETVKEHKGWLWEKIVKFGTSVTDWTMNVLGYAKNLITDIIPTYVKKGVNLLKKAGRFVGALIDPLPDVYVRGSTLAKPALSSNLLRIGFYKDAGTGKTILSFGDIKGEVIDGDGNTVLTIEDIAKGLVDKDGKPIKTLAEKILGGVMKGAIAAGKKALDLGAWVFGKLGVSVDFLKGIGSWISNLELDLGFGGKKIHERLVEIRDILLHKFNMKVAKTGTETKPSVLKDIVNKRGHKTKRRRNPIPGSDREETVDTPPVPEPVPLASKAGDDAINLDTDTVADIMAKVAAGKLGKVKDEAVDKIKGFGALASKFIKKDDDAASSVISLNSQGEAIASDPKAIVDYVKGLSKRKRKPTEGIISVSTDLVTVTGSADTFKASGLFKILDKLNPFKFKNPFKKDAADTAGSSGSTPPPEVPRGRYDQPLPPLKGGMFSKLRDKFNKFRRGRGAPAPLPGGTLALPAPGEDFIDVDSDGNVIHKKPKSTKEALNQLHDRMSSNDGIVGREYNRSVSRAKKVGNWLSKGKKYVPEGMVTGAKNMASGVMGIGKSLFKSPSKEEAEDPVAIDKGHEKEFHAKSNIVDKLKAKWNDRDASGRRDNDQMDRLDKLKHDEEVKRNRQHEKASTDPKYKMPNIIDTLMDKAGAFMSSIKDMFGGAVSGLMGFFLGKGGGFWSKIGNLMMSPFKLMGKGLGGLASVGNVVKDGVGAVASKMPGTTRVVTQLASKAMTAARIFAAVDGGLLASTLAITGWALSAPVVIGAVAVAGAVAAGYYGWKYFTRDDIKPIDEIRFRQYGAPPSVSDQYHKVKQLEEYFDDGTRVSYGKAGASVIDGNVDIEEIYSIFDIDKGDINAVSAFNTWYRRRFLPFFLTHLTALYSVNPKTAIGDIDKLKDEEKARYLDKISYESGPYNVTDSPFKGLATLSDTKSDALTLIANIRKGLVIPKDHALDKVDAVTKLEPAAKPAKDPNDPGYKYKPYKDDSRPSTTTPPPLGSTSGSSSTANKPVGEDGPSGEPSAKTAGVNEAGTPTAKAIPLNKEGFKDGSDGMKYRRYAGRKPSHWELVNPYLRRNFMGMIQEYGEKTGKTVTVNSDYRTYAEQEDSYKRGGAAKPGHSLHEKGLAIDVNSADLDALEAAGLMRKYGFTRPVGGENWHIEAAGIQDDYQRAKIDPAFADSRIQASLNKGGGGWGILPGKKALSRDIPYAKSLWGESMSADVRDPKSKTDASSQPSKTSSIDSAPKPTSTSSGSTGGSAPSSSGTNPASNSSTPTGGSSTPTSPFKTLTAEPKEGSLASSAPKPAASTMPSKEPSTGTGGDMSTPVKARPPVTGGADYFIGDSIALGYKGKGEGDTVKGRNPDEVLSAIKKHSAENPDFYRGKQIHLSTGLSNDQSKMKSIEAQMDALKESGANVSVYGVSNDFPGGKAKEYNDSLAKSAEARGFTFSGGFEAGPDHVHPKNYSKDPSKGTGKPPAAGASSSAPASSPVTSPAIQGPLPLAEFNKGASRNDAIPQEELAKGVSIMSTLMSKYGYSKAAAAGILGNATTESHLSTSVDKRGNGKGAGVGMFQWLQPRVGAIEKQFGKKISSMSEAEQLEAMEWENKQPYFRKGNMALRAATDPVEAAKIFDDKFEASYEAIHGRHSPKRLDYATRYFSLPDSVLKGSRAASTGMVTDLKDDPNASLSEVASGNVGPKSGPRTSSVDSGSTGSPSSAGSGSGGSLGGGESKTASIAPKSIPYEWKEDKAATPFSEIGAESSNTSVFKTELPSKTPTRELPIGSTEEYATPDESNEIDSYKAELNGLSPELKAAAEARPDRGRDTGPLYKPPVTTPAAKPSVPPVTPSLDNSGFKSEVPPPSPTPEPAKIKPPALTGAPPAPPKDMGAGLSNDTLSKDTRDIGRILSESLDVQKKMLSAIVDLKGGTSATSPTGDKSTPTTSSSSPQKQDQVFKMPDTPSVQLTPRSSTA
jgi:hypothetical protein